jgi:hypothetical protein
MHVLQVCVTHTSSETLRNALETLTTKPPALLVV